MKKLLFTIIAILAISTPVYAYTVRSGDSMWKIAQNANISLTQLIGLNPQVKNPSIIFPGQEIITSKEVMLGVATSTIPTPTPRLYGNNAWTGTNSFSNTVSFTSLPTTTSALLPTNDWQLTPKGYVDSKSPLLYATTTLELNNTSVARTVFSVPVTSSMFATSTNGSGSSVRLTGFVTLSACDSSSSASPTVTLRLNNSGLATTTPLTTITTVNRRGKFEIVSTFNGLNGTIGSVYNSNSFSSDATPVAYLDNGAVSIAREVNPTTLSVYITGTSGANNCRVQMNNLTLERIN